MIICFGYVYRLPKRTTGGGCVQPSFDLLHLTIATLLGYGSLMYFNGKDVPRIWYVLVLLLAIAAFGYHGYWLAKRVCN